MSLKYRTFKNISFVGISKFLSKFLTIIGTVILMRILDPYDFGIIAIGTAMVAAFRQFEVAGINTALIKKKEVDEVVISTAFVIKAAISLIFFVSAFFLAPYWAYFYEEPKAAPVIRLLSFYFIISAFSFIPDTNLYRNLEYKKLIFPEFFRDFFKVVSTISFAYSGYGYWSLAYGTIIGEFCRCICLNYISPWKINLRYDKNEAIALFSFGKWVMLSTVFYYLYNFIDYLIIGKFLSVTVLAYYWIAYSWGHFVSDNIRPLFLQVLFPTLSKFQSEPSLLSKGLTESIKYVSILVFPISIGIVSVADIFVPLYAGNKWDSVILPLQILSLSGLVRSLMIGGSIFYIKDKPHYATALVASNAILLGILIMIFINWYGIIGVCVAVVISFTLMAVVQFSILSSLLDISFFSTIRPMAVPLISSLAMFAIIILLKTTGYNFQSTIGIISLILIGFLSYSFLILIFTKGRIVNELKHLIIGKSS